MIEGLGKTKDENEKQLEKYKHQTSPLRLPPDNNHHTDIDWIKYCWQFMQNKTRKIELTII